MTFLTDLIVDFWQTLSEMSPYLLLGFLVAGLLSVWISPAAVERHLGNRGFWSILKASLFGIPLPLCSCGVIPVSMSLHKHGAGKGATASFLLSTPQIGVDSILVTYSLMGPTLAIFRPLAALATGLFGGSLVELVEKNNTSSEKTNACNDDCCSTDKPKANWFVRAMRHGFVTLPADIGRSMLIGLAIAALISAVVPDDFFASYLAGGGGLVAMLVMLAAGIPVYVCATASVPVAVALMAKGLSPGAAMVFLMTGPATNAAALATLWGTLGKRSAIAYLGSVIVCALASGVLIDQFIFVGGFDPDIHAHHTMLPQGVTTVSAVALLGVLGFGIYRKHKNNLNNITVSSH